LGDVWTKTDNLIKNLLVKSKILERFEAFTEDNLNNLTDQPPQNALVVRFCQVKMKRLQQKEAPNSIQRHL